MKSKSCVRRQGTHTAALMLMGIGVVVTANAADTNSTSSSSSSGNSTLFGGTLGGAPISVTDVDFSVPESPALAVLGSSTTKVTQPTTPKELATQLLQGTDANGVIQSGLALDFVPYLLFAGDHATLADYNQRSGFNATRILSNIQLSVGTVKDASAGSNAVRIATGLRYVVFDLGDPRSSRSLSDCFDAAGPDTSHVTDEASLAKAYQDFAADKSNIQHYQKCLSTQKQASWNRSAMELGLAPSWTSATGSFSDLKSSTMAWYLTAGYGFEKVPWLRDNVQLLGHLQATLHDVVPQTSTTQSYQQDTRTSGIKLRVCADCMYGTPQTYVSVEADRIEQQAEAGHPSGSYKQLSITGERRIASNLYLNLQIGGTGRHPGASGSNGNSFLVGGLKWSLDNSSQAPSDAFSRVVGENH